MAVLTEGKHTGEFIGELAIGIGYHVDEITVLSGEVLEAGAVLGKIAASGKYVAYNDDGTDDGRRTVAGILVEAVDATGADAVGRALVRGPAIVNKNDLVWLSAVDAGEQATAITAMLGLGIKAV